MATPVNPKGYSLQKMSQFLLLFIEIQHCPYPVYDLMTWEIYILLQFLQPAIQSYLEHGHCQMASAHTLSMIS